VWSQPSLNGSGPGKRWGHSAAVISRVGHGTIIYTGGREGSKPLSMDSVFALPLDKVTVRLNNVFYCTVVVSLIGFV
jgi:hypothetical protein